jgi:hypothetical protein
MKKISPLEQARLQGRNGDTMLAHINPREAELLKALGGSGTINPKTGLPEFWGWNDFVDTFIAPVVDPVSEALHDVGEATFANDVQEAITSPVSEVVHNVLEGTDINDTVEDYMHAPLKQADSDFAHMDEFVNDHIPGGWTLPAALAVAIATGYTDPSAFGAEAGAEVGGDVALETAGEGALETAGEGALESGAEFGSPELDPTGSMAEQASSFGSPELDPTGSMADMANPSYWQQLQNSYSTLPAYAKNILSGAGKGMATNSVASLLYGRPITPQGLAISGISGGIGGGVAGATDSNWLGGLSAVGANALLNKTFSPTTMASALPYAAAGLSNTGSSSNMSNSTSSPLTTGSTGSSSTTGSSSGLPSALSGQPLTGAPVYGSNAQILQQLKQLDPSLLARIAPHLSANVSPLQVSSNAPPTGSPPSQATGGSSAQQSNPYSSLMQTMLADKGGSNPSSGLSHTLMSSGLSSLGSSMPGYKKGGSIHHSEQSEHVPEFITGETGHYVKGKGDGQSDDIPAMLADGEYVFDADTVAALGNGSSDAGAKLLDHFRETLREHKRSAPTDKIPPAASPLAYMKEALKRHSKG